MKRLYAILSLILVLCVFSLPLFSTINLYPIWGDNMVLQQNSQVIFAGHSTSSKSIYAIASWDNKKVYAERKENGYFELSLTTPSYGGPYTIYFHDGDVLTLDNILIGEVWFCSGQSNMEMPVKGFRGQPVHDALPYILEAKESRPLRLYTVENRWNTTPQKTGIIGEWKTLSSKNVAEFSATGYFFGDLLQKTLDVPVGLINCSWSASKIEAWMSEQALNIFPDIEIPQKDIKEFGWPAGTPTLLWNGMVHPWKGFPIKGVIWYQGEANSPNPQLYKELFPVMVNEWREFFNSPDMPFYYVQIAPWQSEGVDKLDWALFRQAQLELMDEVHNVGMVTTLDAGSEKFIHPPHKIKVGERLAYWALGDTYGLEGFKYSPPVFENAQLKDGFIEVTFRNGEDGLTPENEVFDGFELVDKEGTVYPAKAEIINGSPVVKVWNDQVPQPVEVRYCFRNYMPGSLFNNLKIPAAPFRAAINN